MKIGLDTPHHIFLVDDEEAVRLILTDLFESRGYRITEAVDGAAALEQLKNPSDEDTPDLILADYQMPNLNGVDFLVAAHDIGPQAVRILLTAHGDLEVAVNAINEARVYKFIPNRGTTETCSSPFSAPSNTTT